MTRATWGPVFGDLAGSVVAEPLKNAIGFRHSWVTTSGDTIKFKDALLQADKSDFLDDGNVVAVRWGHYRSGQGSFWTDRLSGLPSVSPISTPRR